MGFTLIEIMIVIIISLIIIGSGGIYLASFWQEHRISLQKDILHREALYAMDFIINGEMRKENHTNRGFRYAGIIGSHRVEILDEGRGIEMRGRDDVLIGRIRLGSNDTSLLFIDSNEKIRTIIPQGQDPYNIEISFTEKKQYLYDISLILEKKGSSQLQDDTKTRDLNVRMRSTVGLRNFRSQH